MTVHSEIKAARIFSGDSCVTFEISAGIINYERSRSDIHATSPICLIVDI